MKCIIYIATIAVLCVSAATPALAQDGAYVGASVGMDAARFSSAGDIDNPATGEAFSWALRAGAPIASRFGVELEFVRPESIENNETPDVRILGSSFPFSAEAAAALALIGATTPIISPINFSVRTEQRNTTLAASVWARQEISPKFSMVYLGGIGFFRIEQEFEYSFSGGGSRAPTILPRSSRLIQYGVGPMAGVEARVGMSDHLRLVPGVRLQALQGGWIVRPAIGLAWEF